MTKEAQSPATKEDVRLLMEQIGKYYDATHTRIDTLDERIEDLSRNVEGWKDEVKQHFDLAVEQIHHELAGAKRDELETIKDRLTRLERHFSLTAA